MDVHIALTFWFTLFVSFCLYHIDNRIVAAVAVVLFDVFALQSIFVSWSYTTSGRGTRIGNSSGKSPQILVPRLLAFRGFPNQRHISTLSAGCIQEIHRPEPERPEPDRPEPDNDTIL